ncbi:MAG TPA: hypothetical protein PJ995_21600 [Cyclobacteriaceae bacterium]|nr:hypothetical protein [Chitinophagales bacterium]HMX02947.1 hypothetical protein [Cyclobacteriaceae bacterium]
MKDLRKKLEEQLTSFEAACKMYDVPADKAVPAFEFFPERDRVAMQKLSELVLIIRAANKIANNGEEWLPTFNDGKWKSVPWFKMKGPGGSGGFRFNDFGNWNSFSFVGSRLCFLNDTVGEYVVEKFHENYKAFFVVDKK